MIIAAAANEQQRSPPLVEVQQNCCIEHSEKIRAQSGCTELFRAARTYLLTTNQAELRLSGVSNLQTV